jgi:hypothetical protein
VVAACCLCRLNSGALTDGIFNSNPANLSDGGGGYGSFFISFNNSNRDVVRLALWQALGPTNPILLTSASFDTANGMMSVQPDVSTGYVEVDLKLNNVTNMEVSAAHALLGMQACVLLMARPMVQHIHRPDLRLHNTTRPHAYLIAGRL